MTNDNDGFNMEKAKKRSRKQMSAKTKSAKKKKKGKKRREREEGGGERRRRKIRDACQMKTREGFKHLNVLPQSIE